MTRYTAPTALAALMLLAACMSGSSASPPRAATAVPASPSALAAVPSASAPALGSTAAGATTGSLPNDLARPSAGTSIDALRRRLTVRVADRSYVLDSAEFLLLPEVPEAATLLEPRVDREAVKRRMEALARELDEAPAADIITDAEAYSSTITFVRRPGRALDVEAAVETIAAALTDPAAGDVALELSPRIDQKLPFDELERGLQQHATFWRGTAGVYVYDLETGESAAVNGNTVFSGASVFKVPIMIYAYSRLGALNGQQQVWMERMIGASGNYEATRLLAAAVGGWSTDDAFVAAGEMSAMLRELGFRHTYMLVPYEGSAYLRREGKLPAGGPLEEGDAPFTEADPFVRTTPAEIARLFAMLDACASGSGPLIEKLGDRLNAGLCDEMLGRLRLPHDQTRMAAGLPPDVPIAHKGGWTSDMQADVGIVDSPGGRYVAAIWVYRDLADGYVTGPTAKASPYLADFSHTIYSFYNPDEPTQ